MRPRFALQHRRLETATDGQGGTEKFIGRTGLFVLVKNRWMLLRLNPAQALRLRQDIPIETEPAQTENAPAKIDSTYETMLTEQHFNDWLEQLDKAELFAFDTETTSLDYSKAQIVGVSFAVTPGKAAYVPLAHDYPGVPDQLNRSEILEKLRPLLENPHKAKARAKPEIRYACPG